MLSWRKITVYWGKSEWFNIGKTVYNVFGLLPNLFNAFCTVCIWTVSATKSKACVVILSRPRLPCIIECCSQIRTVLWWRPIDIVLSVADVLADAAAALSATNFAAAAALSAPGGGRIIDHSPQAWSVLLERMSSILHVNSCWGRCAELWEGHYLLFLVANLLSTKMRSVFSHIAAEASHSPPPLLSHLMIVHSSSFSLPFSPCHYLCRCIHFRFYFVLHLAFEKSSCTPSYLWRSQIGSSYGRYWGREEEKVERHCNQRDEKEECHLCHRLTRMRQPTCWS